MKQYLLVGNFGVENLGDEALKEYFLMRYTDVTWRVVSAHPRAGEVPRLPGGLRSLLATPWWRTVAALRQSDGIVFGGGSLFTDTESVYACILWWWHAFVAHLLQKKIILAFQGVGPFRTRFSALLARWVAHRAVYISVRDAPSQERVQSWRVSSEVLLTCDPIVVLLEGKAAECGPETDLLVVIPRKNSRERLRSRVQQAMEEHAYARVRILSLQPSHEGEQHVCQKLQEQLGPLASVVAIQTLDQLVEELAPASLVVTERYHGALAALTLKKKTEIVSQREGDKLESLQMCSPGFGSAEQALNASLLH